jgi:hypothetical protein
MSKQFYAGQEVLFETTLFGKPYVWFKDIDGTIYLVRLNEEGVPQFV